MPKLTPQEIAAALCLQIKGEIQADDFTRSAYATDASIYQIMPACVAYPLNSADVCAIMKFASQNNIPIAPRGAASGLAGECLSTGIVLDFTRHMNKFSISENGLNITAQPGAVLDDVNNALAQFKRKIGPDPSSSNRATIGGCVANNATGAHWLKYGYFASHVKQIKAVLAGDSEVTFENNTHPADGIKKQLYDLLNSSQQMIKDAQPATKRSRAGYHIANAVHDGTINMASLLAGSEGTLAVYTEITLSTVPLPAAKALIQAQFDSLDHMARAIEPILATDVWACELMDQKLIQMTAQAHPQYKDILALSSPASLLIEQCGDPAELDAKINATLKSLHPFALRTDVFKDAPSQALLWKSRKDAVPLLFRTKGDKKPIPFIEDVSVEPSRLGEYIEGLGVIAKKYQRPMSYYGHAGDGEIHVRPYLDLGDSQDLENFRAIADETFALALSLGGTISGEHAVGIVRAPYIEQQFGKSYYDLLRKIKTIFDSAGIMNPGKIISDVPGAMTANLRAACKAIPGKLKTSLNIDAEKFRLEVEQCCGDGLCRAILPGSRMCPSFRGDPDEMNSPRARANLLRHYTAGLISQQQFDSPESKKLLDSCINCKMCSVECPSDVDVSNLMIEARARHIAANGISRTCWVLARNRYLSILANTFAPAANILLVLYPVRWTMEKFTGIDRRRPMPKFQWGQFIPKARKYLARKTIISTPTDKVAYFVDTFVNFNDHALGFAVIDVLTHNNIEVMIPNQLAVPLPAGVYGDIKKARADIAKTIKPLADAVRNGCKIVCSEPSAALFLKTELPLFDNSPDANLVSENTFELMSYLLNLQQNSNLKPFSAQIKTDLAYHAPCHLLAAKTKPATLALFQKSGGITITDLNSSCCGLAGTFGMQKKNFDKSLKIAAQLSAALVASNLPVVTECSACKLQIEFISSKPVHHPIQLLAQAYGLIKSVDNV
ncbi:MAG: hypothetical protein A2Y07_10735 [Planctomycetes bacterium GWF2_50_10]|nr:MAG: hypothetical protein A2Y07_10735 [Planctomycetes bacterium GWF2_50_10]